MITPTISIAGQPGRIFEGEVPDTFCFVPQDCIQDDGDAVRVEELDYIVSGWDVRNMRFNDRVEGRHLFPNVLRPISDLESGGVRVFLDRIQVVGAGWGAFAS